MATAEQGTLATNLALLKRFQLGIPVFLVIVLSMMVLPIPAFGLDVLFTFNIAFGLLVLLASVYAVRPLDFAVFPTILLITTLFRLALNVASTRVVLLNGHTGTDAAGEVIRAFGDVVVGGSYTVGLVVFSIFIIINFVVVTKGAGRVSEVSARFMLDAMPGKQMAIDADVNAGLITQDQAQVRREEIAREADFYGSMDGASKFVRGDAIAGILILLINLIGGLVIGMVQHDLGISEAIEFYALLTIGDGLAAQIPALLLSTAAAIMVTRVSDAQVISQQVISQMFSNPSVLFITGGIVIVLGLIPGMPHFAFISIALLIIGAGWLLQQNKMQKVAVVEQPEEAPAQTQSSDVNWDDVSPIDMVGLDIGFRVISLVDQESGGELTQRIKGIRKKLSQEFGFLMPSVHIRDNLELSPNSYRISLKGVVVGQGEVHVGMELAINPGQAVMGNIEGIHCQDPTFGLDAYWIAPERKEQALASGFTVVDASTVITTHVSHIMQTHVDELLGHEEVQKLLDKLKDSGSSIVEDTVPAILPKAIVVRVLQNLLRERIPIRDIKSILQTLAEVGPKTQEPEQLTEAVRVTLARLILQNINPDGKELSVITLDNQLEQLLMQTVQSTNGQSMPIEPGLAEKIQKSLMAAMEKQEIAGEPTALLVAPLLRPLLARFVKAVTPYLAVMSYQELPDTAKIKIVGVIGDSEVPLGTG